MNQQEALEKAQRDGACSGRGRTAPRGDYVGPRRVGFLAMTSPTKSQNMWMAAVQNRINQLWRS